MNTKSVSVGRAVACSALTLGLLLSPLLVSQGMAAAAKAPAKAKAKAPAAPAFQPPIFNTSDPILKCTAHTKTAASTYAVVQIPVELLDDASIAWERQHPDTAVCAGVSADSAIDFLSKAVSNPNLVASEWRPTAENIKAAAAAAAPKPLSPEEIRQAAADSAKEQALAAAGKGDYVTALAQAQKTAELGYSMDKDQVAYFTQRAAQQQKAVSDAAKLKAEQAAAAATAAQIMDRQQKDYAERAKKAERAKFDAEPSAAAAALQGQIVGQFTSSVGAANAQNKLGQTSSRIDSTTSTVVPDGGFDTRSSGLTYRVASDCIAIDKVTISVDNSKKGSAMVATNKCSYKVAFQWCVERSAGAGKCGGESGLPEGREELAANARVTLSKLTVGAPVRTWGCEAPGIPRATSGNNFECR